MIPSLTEPITKLLNRDRSPFSSRPEPDRFLLLRVSAEFLFLFFFSRITVCICCWDRDPWRGKSIWGYYNREHVDGFFY